jgi:hypothetical protein
MPGSFFNLERHSGFFFASFLAFLCFAAEAFSILCLRRTGVRLDFFSVDEGQHFCNTLSADTGLDALPGLLTPAILYDQMAVVARGGLVATHREVVPTKS